MLDLARIRSQFPALSRRQGDVPVAYFDGPAGSQVPQRVIDAVADYLARHNANRGACFETSRETDELLAESHRAVADLLGAGDPDEIAFGANMTSLTLALSRAIGRTWSGGDEVIVSRLDHDANVSPWVLAARDAGATVRHIEVHPEDCTLDLESFERQLSDRTKLVAVGYASNATGTINPVQRIVERARSVGAVTFIDAVHYAPHGLIDVREIGCDFLACSAYKFFGPHVGVLWGRRELLESLTPYKLRPSPDTLPGRWMTGTQNHEGIVGTAAAIDYLAELGIASDRTGTSRRKRLRSAFDQIARYEQELVQPLLDALSRKPDVRVWGIRDSGRRTARVPTVSITHARHTPQQMGERLAAQGLWTWPGNHYALPFTQAMGLEPHGTLRMGLLHYNTADEVARLIEALDELL